MLASYDATEQVHAESDDRKRMDSHMEELLFSVAAPLNHAEGDGRNSMDNPTDDSYLILPNRSCRR